MHIAFQHAVNVAARLAGMGHAKAHIVVLAPTRAGPPGSFSPSLDPRESTVP